MTSPKKKLVIGLTGGIGSGKTAVSNHFSKLGITIADADIASRTVMEPETEAYNKIIDYFGEGIANKDKTLDRARLRELVFSNSQKLRWLESVTVPAIMNQLIMELEQSISPHPIQCLSSGGGQHPLIHRNLVVDVMPETQLERAIQRDNNSAEQIKSIMAKQPTRQDRLDYADDVINNDGDISLLANEVSRLHRLYQALSSKISESGNAAEYS
jgi:dephospho-CoA kinase